MPTDHSPRTTTQTVWLVAAVSLLAVLVAGGGWLAWRATTTASPPATAAATPTGVSGGDVAFGAPRLIGGVPWGWPATPEGAVAAAVSAVAVTGQPEVVFDPDRFAQVAAVVFTPEQAQMQAAQVDAARTNFELSGWGDQPASRRMYHFAPLAARLTGFDPAGPSATVEVWAMTLVGIGDAGGAVFTTSTINLQTDPDDSGWQVTGLDSVEGPTPVSIETVSAPGRTRAAVRDAMSMLPLPLASRP